MKDRTLNLVPWVTLRGAMSYLRRVTPRKGDCENDDGVLCWSVGDGPPDAECCPVCLERHDTFEAMKLVRKRLYAATAKLERQCRPWVPKEER